MAGIPAWCRSKCSADGVIVPRRSCTGVRLPAASPWRGHTGTPERAGEWRPLAIRADLGSERPSLRLLASHRPRHRAPSRRSLPSRASPPSRTGDGFAHAGHTSRHVTSLVLSIRNELGPTTGGLAVGLPRVLCPEPSQELGRSGSSPDVSSAPSLHDRERRLPSSVPPIQIGATGHQEHHQPRRSPCRPRDEARYCRRHRRRRCPPPDARAARPRRVSHARPRARPAWPGGEAAPDPAGPRPRTASWPRRRASRTSIRFSTAD